MRLIGSRLIRLRIFGGVPSRTQCSSFRPVTQDTKDSGDRSCCKIAIALIVPQKGEQTAQACAIAWLRKPSGHLSQPGFSVVGYFRFARRSGAFAEMTM